MTSAPNAKNIDPEQIPAELRERRQWVAWLLRVRADKLTKEPWRPTPRRTFLASSTDPSTWGTF
jgi:primase-polymerase (primpol)-like protein